MRSGARLAPRAQSRFPRPALPEELPLTSTPEIGRSRPSAARAIAAAEQNASLGRRLLGQGRLGEAIDASRRALVLQPDCAPAATTIGDALLLQGRFDEARSMYARALALDPNDAEAANGAGAVLLQLGRPGEAEILFHRVLARHPYHLSGTLNLARALAEQGRLVEAAESCERLLASRPDFAPGHLGLGMFLEAQGRLAEAIGAYTRARDLAPSLTEAQARLDAATHRVRSGTAEAEARAGLDALAAERPEEAEAAFRRALELAPPAKKGAPDSPVNAGHCALHLNLAHALIGQWRFDEAEASCRNAIEHRADSAEANYLLGCVLRNQGRPREAIEAYRQAIRCDPAHAAAHWNLAMALLLVGEYEEGWREYEWRWRLGAEVVSRRTELPLWTGEPLEGRTVLVTSEQGFGDTIQFARYATLLSGRGARVILECQSSLRRLLGGTPGIAAVVVQGEPLPHCDFQVPLLSLPGLFDTRLDTIPARVPYLRPVDAESFLPAPAAPGLRVGLVWAGSPRPNPRRSCTLEELAPLWRISGVTWYSLQAGARRADLGNAATPLVDLGEQLTDFSETAAIISQLDLVISVDTSVAHLAGALGVPVWVLLIRVADWRWLLDREDCPWYPTARLFRQNAQGGWGEVVERVAAELARLTERQ